MTKQELDGILGTVVTVLTLNKNLISPSLLTKIRSVVDEYKENRTLYRLLSLFAGLNEEEIDRIIANVIEALEVEKELIETNLTEKTISGINNLRDRPLAMRMLATLM